MLKFSGFSSTEPSSPTGLWRYGWFLDVDLAVPFANLMITDKLAIVSFSYIIVVIVISGS